MRALPALLFVVLGLAGSSLCAEPLSQNGLDDNAQAVERGSAGLAAFERGEWDAAYRLFLEAEHIAHSPVFLLYMARARERQGELAEALVLYESVETEDLPNDAPRLWTETVSQAHIEAEALRARIRAAAALLRPQTPGAEPPAPAPSPPARSRRVAAPRQRAKPRTSPNQRAAAIATVVGATSALVGLGAGTIAFLELRSLEQGCPRSGCDPADEPRLDTIDAWASVADVGFAIAGASLATAAVFLWVVPEERSEPPLVGLAGSMRF